VVPVSSLGDRIYESFTVHSQTLRQVPDRTAQGRRLYHLRKSEAQAATRVTDHGEN
jgi:hypothetical protein